jgi:hypothetical protein
LNLPQKQAAATELRGFLISHPCLRAEGKRNKLIGADLAILEVTTESHVQSIFPSLNVLSRTAPELTATARST